jgi:tetratricopeptide (TPR) repeat protein
VAREEPAPPPPAADDELDLVATLPGETPLAERGGEEAAAEADAAGAGEIAPLEGLEPTYAGDRWATPEPSAPDELPLLGNDFESPPEREARDAPEPDDDLPLLSPDPRGIVPAEPEAVGDEEVEVEEVEVEEVKVEEVKVEEVKVEEVKVEEVKVEGLEVQERISVGPGEVDESDAATQYDLGIAFKEMGLWEEAVTQLERALAAGSNPVATLEVIGECCVESGEHERAREVLERAVHLPGTPAADLVGAYYWLGRAQEAGGAVEPARESYGRVLAIDPAFRDAAGRLEGLAAPGAGF